MKQKYQLQEEIDSLAIQFIKSRKKEYNREQEKLQITFLEKLKFLVFNRSNRYKKYTNHQDMQQEGYEALLMALNSYNPKKGSFSWWTDKYINTKLSRAANNHSTIKMPMKIAKNIKPIKTSAIPNIIDTRNPHKDLEVKEIKNLISESIKLLPEKFHMALNLFYGLNGYREQSVDNICKNLNIGRNNLTKLLNEAKVELRNIIED
jgi:RNA polymerase sigma factor (sigma-70 family)